MREISYQPGIHKEPILIVSPMIIIGFWLSGLVLNMTKKAGIRDVFRYWSYVVGFTISVFLVWLESVT